MSPIRTAVVLGVVGLAALLALPVLAAPDETDSDNNRMLAEVRQATRQYQDVEAAKEDGYHLEDHCVPGMGFHALNPALAFEELPPPEEPELEDFDDDVDHRKPEVLVYAPRGEDNLELVAVEYLSSDETEQLFDRDFDPAIRDPQGRLIVPPSRHAWVWQGNPDGVFTAENPKISCPESE